jgi:hypothetical protein
MCSLPPPPAPPSHTPGRYNRNHTNVPAHSQPTARSPVPWLHHHSPAALEVHPPACVLYALTFLHDSNSKITNAKGVSTLVSACLSVGMYDWPSLTNTPKAPTVVNHNA